MTDTSVRTRLLEGTLEVLGAHGVAGTTSRRIADAAGTNLQAITYHFRSKDALVGQALVHAVRRWLEPVRQALARVDTDPIGGLVAAVFTLQQSLAQARTRLPAYVEALAAATRHEQVQDEIVSLLREMRDDVAARIRELAATGLLADWADPEAIAALLVAAGDGFVLHATLDPEGYDLDRALSQVVQVLLAARRVGPDDKG